jgi:hypothetical protein
MELLPWVAPAISPKIAKIAEKHLTDTDRVESQNRELRLLSKLAWNAAQPPRTGSSNRVQRIPKRQHVE